MLKFVNNTDRARTVDKKKLYVEAHSVAKKAEWGREDDGCETNDHLR